MKAEDNVHRSVTGVLMATAVILAVPLLAMQVTDEVVWTAGDFLFAGVALAGTGLAYILVMAARKGAGAAYRGAVGLALGTALFLLWAIGAVGVIGSEQNAANLMYFGVLAVGLIGALIARFRPSGMVRVLLATAAAQAAVTAMALVAGHGDPTWGGPLEIAALNGMYIALWAGAAALFRSAARQPPGGAAGV